MDPWVSLFSGGKDSSWALYRALERGLPVERLVTVHPAGDSYLYHVPATELASLAAESIGVPLRDVRPADFDRPDGAAGREAADAKTATDDGAGADHEDVADRGDRELEPLAEALADLADELGGLGGVTVGAVESDYQLSRIEAAAARLDADLFAPLWQAEPAAALETMLDAGFEILVVRVAAGGLDERWLGRTLDDAALAELRDRQATHGVHVMGEGGEFETLVTNAPHMSRPIELDYECEFDGVRGSIRIDDAWLGESG